MTQKEILEGNKLIAEFMGYVYFEPNVLIDNSDCGGIYDPTDIYSKVPIEVNDYPQDEQKYFKDLPNPDFGKEKPEHWRNDLEKISWGSLNRGSYIEELNYDWSWNELMPVVQKCCSDLRDMGFDRRGSYNPKLGYVSEIYVMRLDNPIENVWLEVINHIKRFKK